MADEKKDNMLGKYVQLTGIGFQMMATMFVFIWLGRKADEKWAAPDQHYFALIGTLLGLGVSLYLILQQLKRINDKESD